VDKCADYEDQLRIMRTAQNGLLRTDTADSNSLAPRRQSQNDGRPSTANSETAKQSRFSFLRRGSPAQAQLTPPPTSQSPPDTELIEQLERERALRAKAEEKARNVDSEIEELSVQLFSQANEMVAAERKARAKLEARVEQLEKKDKEKMARLERLEKAVARIDRVKAILGAPGSAIPRKP
jgi:chromosome segregation ATPase